MNASRIQCGLLLLLAALLGTGCLGPRQGLFPPKPGEPKESVFVVNHGWHTGLVFKRDQIPPGLWPEKADFPQAQYLEVGWGDDAWYRATNVDVCIAFQAMFLCDRSVLSVVGFAAPVATYFPESEILRVDLSERGFTNICEFVSERFNRKGAARAAPVQHGFYPDSWFYPAKGRYYLTKTCNVWTARALRTAGCPITPVYAVTAGNLMSQTRRFRTVIRGKQDK